MQLVDCATCLGVEITSDIAVAPTWVGRPLALHSFLASEGGEGEVGTHQQGLPRVPRKQLQTCGAGVGVPGQVG